LTPVFFMILVVMAQTVQARDYSALVVEPDTGRVLYEKDANELRHPASVTKMMTLYLVFEALDRGEITLNTPFNVSRYAVLRPPSRLGLTAGDTLNVEDAILALVTRSANDAASVIAENLGGTEPAFAEMMTSKARALGMNNSVFRNASGLPDPSQVTTAWDMYRLGRALIRDFPRYYSYFSTRRFYYRGQGFDNHNHLMESYTGMDGIKTGFINSSGFNLVASAKRGGHRLIGVVFGGPSAVRRDRHMREILDDGFAQLSGASPGNVIAEFERQSGSGSRRAFETESEPDEPHLAFGNAKRFKAKAYRSETTNSASAPSRATHLVEPKKHGVRSKAAGMAGKNNAQAVSPQPKLTNKTTGNEPKAAGSCSSAKKASSKCSKK
jgi:D-alanyl-D-alanine carboxypeptidase